MFLYTHSSLPLYIQKNANTALQTQKTYVVLCAVKIQKKGTLILFTAQHVWIWYNTCPTRTRNMQEKSEMKFDVDWEANEKVSIDKQPKKCKQGVICQLEWKCTHCKVTRCIKEIVMAQNDHILHAGRSHC